jgi:hypothetical protein
MHAARAQSQFAPLARSAAAGLGRLAESLLTPRAAADELDEARELLDYWEQRARRLPRWAVMRRREAREMAGRWRGRVREAEQHRYGRGLLGAASQLAVDHRMPAAVAHRGRQAIRIAACTALATAVTVALVLAAAVALVAEAVLHAL